MILTLLLLETSNRHFCSHRGSWSRRSPLMPNISIAVGPNGPLYPYNTVSLNPWSVPRPTVVPVITCFYTQLILTNSGSQFSSYVSSGCHNSMNSRSNSDLPMANFSYSSKIPLMHQP